LTISSRLSRWLVANSLAASLDRIVRATIDHGDRMRFRGCERRVSLSH
jgi:hypothetical protein